MRALAAALLVAACATAPPTPPPERVAGCWIARDEGVTVTMRWLRDTTQPGALRGDLLSYDPGGATGGEHYTLQQRGGAWSLCQIEDAGERCWLVAEGEGGSLEGGRAFIDAHGEAMTILVIDHSGVERRVFSGRRDGCD